MKGPPKSGNKFIESYTVRLLERCQPSQERSAHGDPDDTVGMNTPTNKNAPDAERYHPTISTQ